MRFTQKNVEKCRKNLINTHSIPKVQIIQKYSINAEKSRKFRKIQKNAKKFIKMQKNFENVEISL
jgi:hypothetical protein